MSEPGGVAPANSQDVTIQSLAARVHSFVSAREWCSGHNPKNVVMAIGVEAGELAEIFQWLTPDESAGIGSDPSLKQAVSEEIADILILLLSLCNGLGIDPGSAVIEKIASNTIKYPVSAFRGRSSAHTPKPQPFRCQACAAGEVSLSGLPPK